jgi:hypothetical protein
LCFASWLINTYDWPGPNAEYYAFRRCAPGLFYGCFIASQACLALELISGHALGALASGVATTLTGRPLEPGEKPLHPDVLTVPAHAEKAAAEDLDALEEDE